MASLSSISVRSIQNAQTSGVTDPMQVDAPPEEYDNTKEELYEVDIDSFDLEAYAKNYTGLALIYRLIYIADHCPKLRIDALRLAILRVVKTMNVNLYYVLHRKIQISPGNLLPDVTGAYPADSGLPVFNATWAEVTTQKAAMKLEILDGYLKNYKIYSIKESIRHAHNKIGDHYVNCGKLFEATDTYLKNQFYCTNSSNFITLCLNIIKVFIYLQNWSHVVDFIIKAESTPDYTENSKLQTTYSSTLKCMMGLAELAGRKYKQAAHNFLQTNFNYWNSTDIMTLNDIAIYGGLCALATFNRSELKKYIICNDSFKLFLELEPEVRVVILKFYDSKYEVCLTILNKIKPKLLLDMHIGSHINQLYSNIRRKAMIQYCCPYDSADLRKMALCFNTSIPDLENELMQLILNGYIKARIDSINKILYAKHPNQRVETFEKTMEMAQKYSRCMHILILRSQMIKHQRNAKLSDHKRYKKIGKSKILKLSE